VVAATAVAGIRAVAVRFRRMVLGSRDWQRDMLVTLMPYLGLVRLRMHRLCGINVQGARSRHR
jgi:hypothetical protein